MAVEWERIPDGLPEDFQALDGDEIVGRVYQHPHGLQAGQVRCDRNATRTGRPFGRSPDGPDRSPRRRGGNRCDAAAPLCPDLMARNIRLSVAAGRLSAWISRDPER